MHARMNSASAIQCQTRPCSSMKATIAGIAAMRDMVRMLAKFSMEGGSGSGSAARIANQAVGVTSAKHGALSRSARSLCQIPAFNSVPSTTMEVIVDLPGDGLVDAFDRAQIRKTRACNRARRPEMQQQRLLALGADPGDLVQLRLADQGRALGAMGADDETVSFVAQ